jgi:hypothetical protein
MEDNYYKHLINKNSNYEPIQLIFFKLKIKSDEDFFIELKNLKQRIFKFCVKHQHYMDDNFFCEMKDCTDIKKINCSIINKFIIRYNIQTYSFFVLINHQNFGGADYLILGSIIFKGETDSLIKQLEMNFLNKIKIQLYKTQFLYKIYTNLYNKIPRNRLKKEHIIYSKITEIDTNKILYNILKNITNTLSDTDKIVCWIPYGFEKNDNSPSNNLGIMLFTFYKYFSFDMFIKCKNNNEKLIFGSNELLNSDYYIPRNTINNNVSKIKKQIDVVISLANIIKNELEIDLITGGMYYKMNNECPYPFYIWCLTINNETHISYSVSDYNCNINKLINTTNGIDITDNYIYQLNNITSNL